ncbi:hypothetical protein B0H63DRAFT_468808 [Podospora didyma]|uniref:Secreted protein n=1 Tax=Podospora didyma TaxID=330526 RepID=A0AAE0NSR2_9PEZI|nr:hypothetical protein B0H63DRAFT_468808 [Podospora didyma]
MSLFQLFSFYLRPVFIPALFLLEVVRTCPRETNGHPHTHERFGSARSAFASSLVRGVGGERKAVGDGSVAVLCFAKELSYSEEWLHDQSCEEKRLGTREARGKRNRKETIQTHRKYNK